MFSYTTQAGRAKTQDAANTPQRRSLYDLQKLIDEVFDGFASSRSGTHTHREDSAGEDPQDEEERTCRAADLPAILTAFEKRRNVMLLDENEMEMLKAFTEQVCSCPFALLVHHILGGLVLKLTCLTPFQSPIAP